MKKRQKNRLNLLVICLILTISMTTRTTFAHDKTYNDHMVQIDFQKIRDQDILLQIDEVIMQLNNGLCMSQDICSNVIYVNSNVESNEITPFSRAYYTSETVQTKYITIAGFAGGQPPGGYRFPTGGGFFWDEGSGPSASASVSFSLPFKIIDVSVSMGSITNSSSKGLYVPVPNTTQYFKLYVSKTMEVRQVNIYRQETVNSPKVLWMVMYPSILYRQEQYAKPVN